uniref:Uncharacterized protein n=1 Tax=Panagrolaimus sp. ES5 TaxID=591445 RepID=A0AC34FCP3_9BILA
MILCKVLFLNLLILFCNAAPSHPSTAAPTPQPVLQIAQKLLSNIGRFPTAIQEGMTGKTGEIRKIVSSALGGGIIGQLVENPIQAAGNLGFDLDQFGINKTMLENSIGISPDKAWQTNLLPMNKGDLLFSNQINNVAVPTTPAGPEPLYIDGKKVMPENEDAVLNGIFGGERNNLKQVQPQKGRRLESAQYYGNEKARMRMQENRPTPNSFVTDSQAQNIPSHRLQNLPVPPPPVSPAPPSDSMDSANSIINSVMPFINTPQMPNFNNNDDNNGIIDENRAVAHAINRVSNGDAEIRRVPMARVPEFNKMNAKILSLEQRLNEQQELLAKQHGEEKEMKVQKILETLKFGKGNRLSALQKHLRYSPEAVNDDLRLDTNPLKPLPQIECECESVSLNQLKGTWVQALASDSLISELNKGMGKIFDTKAAKLECAEISVTPPRDYNPEYSHFVLGVRIQNATNVVRFAFTKQTSTHVTLSLQNQQKISANQMDRMEFVEHVNVCSS